MRIQPGRAYFSIFQRLLCWFSLASKWPSGAFLLLRIWGKLDLLYCYFYFILFLKKEVGRQVGIDSIKIAAGGSVLDGGSYQ